MNLQRNAGRDGLKYTRSNKIQWDVFGKTRGGVTTAGHDNTMRENNYETIDSRKTRTGIHTNTLRTYGLDKAGRRCKVNEGRRKDQDQQCQHI